MRLTMVIAAVLLLGACSSDGGPSTATTATDPPTATEASTTTSAAATTTVAASRPFTYQTVSLTFVDDSRSTNLVNGQVLPSRTLPTTLYLPDTTEPVPLILFSHGYGASPAKFERLMGAWATAGYAVAAPAFPLSSDLIPDAERAPGDVANQPSDIVFLLDQLLAGEYAERFDPERLAAAGLSLGGLTTYMAAIDTATRDPRFTAAIVMAAVPPSDSFAPASIPTMVLHGELDPLVPIALTDATFARLPSPTYDVTMLGAFHAEAFEDEEENQVFPDREKYHPIVDAATTAFWDTYLLPDPAAEPAISQAADQPGITRFVRRVG